MSAKGTQHLDEEILAAFVALDQAVEDGLDANHEADLLAQVNAALDAAPEGVPQGISDEGVESAGDGRSPGESGAALAAASPGSADGDPGHTESSQPGSSQPGSSQPGSSQPGSSQPGSSQPGSSQPGSSQSESSQLGGDREAGLRRLRVLADSTRRRLAEQRREQDESHEEERLLSSNPSLRSVVLPEPLHPSSESPGGDGDGERELEAGVAAGLEAGGDSASEAGRESAPMAAVASPRPDGENDEPQGYDAGASSTWRNAILAAGMTAAVLAVVFFVVQGGKKRLPAEAGSVAGPDVVSSSAGGPGGISSDESAAPPVIGSGAVSPERGSRSSVDHPRDRADDTASDGTVAPDEPPGSSSSSSGGEHEGGAGARARKTAKKTDRKASDSPSGTMNVTEAERAGEAPPSRRPAGEIEASAPRAGAESSGSEGGGGRVDSGDAGKGKGKDKELDALMREATNSDDPARPPAPRTKKSQGSEAEPEKLERLTLKDMRRAMAKIDGKVQDCGKTYDVVDTVKTRVHVAPSGEVVRVEVNAPYTRTGVGGCVANAVKSVRLPPFRGPRRSFNFPFVLSQ